jgi:hypothetical protein
MDMTKLELMRIPFATVLFVTSVLVLWNIDVLSGILRTAGAFICIAVLVYSIVLYSNLDMPVFRH